MFLPVFFYYYFSFMLPIVSGINWPVCLCVLVCWEDFWEFSLCQFTLLKLPLSAVMPQLWYALAAEQGGTGAQSAPGGPVGFFWKTTRSAGNGLVLGRGMLAPAAPRGWWGRVPGACVCQGGLESCASWREEWW